MPTDPPVDDGARVLVGPSTTRSWAILAVPVAFAAIALVATLAMLRIVGLSEPLVVLVPAALTAFFATLAVIFWKRNPRHWGRILAVEHGLILDWRNLFGWAHRRAEIRFDEVFGFCDLSFSPTARHFAIVVSREGAIRLGLAQPTLRADAPDILTRGRLTVHQYAFAIPPAEIIAALRPKFGRRGLEIEEVTGWVTASIVRTWRVRQQENGV